MPLITFCNFRMKHCKKNKKIKSELPLVIFYNITLNFHQIIKMHVNVFLNFRHKLSQTYIICIKNIKHYLM